LVSAFVIGVLAGVAGLMVRAVGERDWSGLRVVEGAFAIGIVLGFVVMLFLELRPS